MPLDEMNLLHAQIYQDYMGYPLVYEWVDIHHHFETPFYYVSYATSAVSALELWADALENRDKAMQIYDKLTQYTINVEYLETLKKVGLSDPFSSDCVLQGRMTFIPPPFLRIKKAAAAPRFSGSRGGFFDSVFRALTAAASARRCPRRAG